MDTNTSIETTLKDMWHSRPARIPKNQGGNAMVAGVCEGVGARYRIDPVIIRLAFVGLSLAFGGGIFVYLLMWMNMPRYGMTTSPWRAINTPKVQLDPQEKKDRDTGWWLLVGLVVFLPSLTAGTGSFAAASLFTLVLAAGALYLLHRSQPVPPTGLSANSTLTAPEGYPHPSVGQTTPPSWDPLGAAPELWHLPDLDREPVAAAPEPRKNRWLIWLIALGGTGLILLSIGATTTGAMFAHYGPRSGSNVEFQVTDDLRDTYDTGIGSTTIDLSSLSSLDDDRATTIDHGIGKVTIIPPKDTRVEFDCAVGVGSDKCPATLNDNAKGGTLTLKVDVGIGEVEVVS
ncbi:PspC domain-containing protein [Corynebacterium qintianiae]|uniref:PspC domain-containing protein n=1 Tax=Corynebacterium qintianiae TaxID=2709392 RepID=A0A7T0KMR1_9CORY|nr:PspC domain-containing protein [Corynebacterium qintianiae]QPK83601.1 PspC domain-containing protein [Corynebacterium qintianiae]